MKQINKSSYLKTGFTLSVFLLLFMSAGAQVSSYSFAQAPGTYTAITGGTVVATATDSSGAGSLDNIIYDLPAGTIPFNLTFDNIVYTGCKISTNGFMTFGTTAPAASGTTTGYVPLSAATAYAGAVSPLGRNLNSYFTPGNASQTGEIRYQTLGSTPNRTFVIQWKNFKNASTGNAYGSVLNFQVRLSETTNVIKVVYSCSGTFGVSPGQVGLRGPNNVFPTNINNRSVTSGTNTWLTSIAGTANTSTCEVSTASLPPAGLTYTFTPLACPAPMNLSTTNVTQTTAQLTWTSPGGGGTFKVEWGLSGFTPGTGTVVNNAVSPVSISGLTGSTNYQFYVQQNCGVSGNSPNVGPFTFQSGGPGEDCSSAILVTVKSSLAGCGYTTVTSGVSQNGPNAICSDATGNQANDDRWLKFVAPSNNKKLVITTTAGTVNDWVMQVWKTCSGNPVDVLKCSDDDNGFMPLITLCQNEYIGGQTYYIRAWTYSPTATGTMNLCVYEDTPCPVPPSNDECNVATLINVNISGACPASAGTYTTKDATSAGNTATCDLSTDQRDVWFAFNTDIYGDIKITFTKLTATNLKAQVYFDCNGGELFCWNPADGAAKTITGLNPNADYILRVWSDSTGVGTFTVCMSDACSSPTATLTGTQSICPGGTAQMYVDFTGNPPFQFSYSDGSTTTPVTTSNNPYSLLVSPSSNKTYSLVSMSDATCSGTVSGTATVTVANPPTVTLANFAPACSNDPIFALSGGSPAGGTYSGTGVNGGSFNPVVGTQTITYTVNFGIGCNRSASKVLTVNAAPSVTLAAFTPVCSNAGLQTLTGGSPAGGTYSGNGVSSGKFDPSGGSSTITYSYTNANGCSNSASQLFTVNPAPIVFLGSFSPVCSNAAPFALTGGTPTGGTYSGTGVSGGNFNPATAGVGTKIITYTFTNGSGCTASDTSSIVVNNCGCTNPLPSVITGTTGVCVPVNGVGYSVPAQAGVTFTWTVPANVTIASGQGTNSITTNWASNAANGSVCVTGTNPCGSAPQACKTVTKRTAVPATAGTITGSTNGCPGESKVYTIRKMTTADFYIWTPPVGATINGSSAPFNTVDTIVTVVFTASFPTNGDTLRVVAGNCKGTSATQRKLKINKAAPATPGTITGQTVGLCTATGKVYSIVAVINATSYTWASAIAGVTINGNPSPFTTSATSVTLNFGTFTTGTLTVKSNNGCGSSANKSLSLKGKLATPGVITGATPVCINTNGVPYSIAAVPLASSYTWTPPAGATIASGQGTTNVTVNFGANTGTANLTVRANGIATCANSANKTLAITRNTCPRLESGLNSNGELLLNAYPNPAHSLMTVQFNAASEAKYKLTLTDVEGRAVIIKTIDALPGENNYELRLNDLSRGVYSLGLQSATENKQLRIVID